VIAPIALLVYAGVVATFGSYLLRKSAWPSRSPRWGIVAWQALVTSAISAVVLAGLALALPTMPLTTDIAALLQACVMSLQAQYATPGGAALSSAGLLLALTVLARVGYCLGAAFIGAARGRRQQLHALGLVARRHDRSGALIIDHSTALAYCLPGRNREIVLTTGALDVLSEPEITAVLAHERAHLQGRHYLLLVLFSALERAFPRVPAFRHASFEVTRLVEMLADDMATRGNDRLTLATALVRLAEGRTPAATLGAGGDTALTRVQRLLAPANPIDHLRTACIVALTAGMLAIPATIVAAPALVVAAADYCPITI